MKCRECEGQLVETEEFVRGYCNSCDEKKHTCTVCGKRVETVWVTMHKGKELGRGHKECLDHGL